jgi:predicted RNA binding protein YcfA (HicA-like mRNA interferase family)
VAKTVKDVISILEQHGWRLARQRGSHRQFKHPNRPALITLAGRPSKTVKPGTLAKIRRDSGIDELR